MNGLSQPPAIAITLEDRQPWQQALIRGQEHGLGCAFRRTLPEHGLDIDFYLVESHTTAGKQHSVAIWTDANDQVWTRCSCDAGWFGRICQHAALVVNRAGRWGALPILSQPPLLANTPALAVGDAVRAIKGGKHGAITFVTQIGQDWLYLVEGPRGAKVGVFLASELERVDVDVAVPA